MIVCDRCKKLNYAEYTNGVTCDYCLVQAGICPHCGDPDLPYTDGHSELRCGICSQSYVRLAPSLEALVFDRLRRI